MGTEIGAGSQYPLMDYYLANSDGEGEALKLKAQHESRKQQ